MNGTTNARKRRVWAIMAGFIVMLWSLCTLTQATGTVVQVNGVAFEFASIPPGRFMMGSDLGDGDERPVHAVNIAYPFDIGRTEVTRRQFRAFVEATGYETVAERVGSAWHAASPETMGWIRKRNWRDPGMEQADDHPVTCISYIDAIAFCQWLSKETGQCFRLPSEAEWEYACRGATTREEADDLEETAWFAKTSAQGTHAVAQKKPNTWGLFDMHGNVAEWCEDTYAWHYGNVPCDGSAHTAPGVPVVAAARRVLRGGSWSSPSNVCRCSFRWPVPSAHRGTDTGFRLVSGQRPADTGGGRRGSSIPMAEPPVAKGEARARKQTLNVGTVAFEFVRIDPGTFSMGSPHRYVDKYNWTYELPIQEVTIDYRFYLGVTEVTREQFDLFVESTGYVTDAEKQGWAFTCVPDRPWHYRVLVDWRFPGFVQTEDEPVTHIGWYDAVAFCQWLSEKTGRHIRLPSEAEWEYACRAGTTGEFAGSLDEMAWMLWNSDKVRHTYPVARKKPNAWGLYDMHGGVWEWVQDVWHEDGNDAPTDGSAWFETTDFNPRGITRGGSFASPPWLCRSYIRMKTPMGQMVHYNNGFRIVCAPPASAPVGRKNSQLRGTACGTVASVPLEIEMPKPTFQKQPLVLDSIVHLEPEAIRPPRGFLVPEGTRNVALGKAVRGDSYPTVGELAMITDGHKQATDDTYVELPKGLQSVTIDLETTHTIYAIQMWHWVKFRRVYFDVIVQVSDDPNFITGVHTVYNNDVDHTAGFGIGSDRNYIETCYGKLLDASGARGRYVRLYSQGNTSDELNHYIEVEVYGRPVR